ncbi:MAG: hypothetical protein JWO24_2833 [Rhodospirillales bacterium]|nr:hypothetical protein [Rhodospirillales bacterium]
MNSTTFAVWISFRASYGWGYEVAVIENDGEGYGLGKWHATRLGAELQLDLLEQLYEGSTLRAREQVGSA